ncbi:secretin N-terminal domain-containing protein [Thermodesulfobacterium thermophilum]|uniref:secretin N-terminal domain-containing protein n=1 Tax=Thermodesulfobacterium thermophilum TaxID=886 RepID=UPI0003B4A5B1|nr:secretin N-terminal domain-containing protein [Thermodesulfobacterium thermophilum]
MKIKIFIFNMLIFILAFMFILSFGKGEAKAKTNLREVFYLKQPVDTLIFEFDGKPQYTLNVDGTKLILFLQNVVPLKSNWVKTLPKDLIKEVDVSLEKNGIRLNLILTKKFNVQVRDLENKILVEFLWEKPLKPVNVVIKDKKVETLEEKTLKELRDILENKISTQPYEILLNERRVSLPLSELKYKGIPITVDFQGADLHAVLRLLSEVGGINILVSDKVTGTVTLKSQNVPWDLLLDAIISNFGLAKLKTENLIVIATLDEVKKYAEQYKDYLKAVAQGKEGIKAEIEAQRDIFDALQKVQEEKNLLITKIFTLKYLRASKVIDLLKSHRFPDKLQELLKDPNKITFEPLTNTIIVKATPKILDEIEAIIKAIDKPRPQIMIEARIVEMRDEYAHKLGIKWGGAAWKRTEHSIWNIAPGHSITTNDTMTTKTPSINIPNTTIFDLGVANSIANLGVALGYFGDTTAVLDVTLSALEESGVARVLSKPQILTLDKEQAIIQQGYRIPYLSYAANINQATVNFIDAGLKLLVTPSVTPEGKIFVDVVMEKSEPDWGRTVQGEPTINTSNISTSALLDNGETLVIGGVKINNISDNIDKVPGLGSIPGAGEFFKRKEKMLSTSELMIFITPKIAYIPIEGIDY